MELLSDKRVFTALDLKRSDANAVEIKRRIDWAARRYVHRLTGGQAKYSTGKAQRGVARQIRDTANKLRGLLSRDPEVSKRVFLSLREDAVPEITNLDANKTILENVQTLQRFLLALTGAADGAYPS